MTPSQALTRLRSCYPPEWNIVIHCDLAQYSHRAPEDTRVQFSVSAWRDGEHHFISDRGSLADAVAEVCAARITSAAPLAPAEADAFAAAAQEAFAS